MNEKELRERLSGKSLEHYDDMTKGRQLGVTNSVKSICNIFIDISRKAYQEEAMATLVMAIADYFKKTRGESSCAIKNALNILISDLKKEGNYSEKLRTASQGMLLKIDNSKDIIVDYASGLIKDGSAVMLYDYASTVGALAQNSKDLGMILNCIIPETRVLDGGHHYAKQFADYGHKVHMIPDAAIYKYMCECDVAFIGAETLFPNGSVYNTIGSDMVAISCKLAGKPFYVMSSMLKVDKRGFGSFEKPLLLRNHSTLFGIPGSICYDLAKIDPEDITAIITENGMIPTKDFYAESKKYFEKIKAT